MTDFAETDHLTAVHLKEDRPRARTPEIQQELDVAIFDLIEENRFQIVAREGHDVPPGPYDLGIGGPRLGLEVGGGHAEALSWSVRPSFGLKHTAKRASVRTEATVTYALGRHYLSAELGLDTRWMSTLALADGKQRSLALDRMQSQMVLTWDGFDRLRARVRLPVRDRGTTLRWASGSLAYTRTTRRLHTSIGIGMMVGKPRDQYTLGTYEWFFWMPYPELDLAIRL